MTKYLKAALKFSVSETEKADVLQLTRLSKVGNSEPWNTVFEDVDSCSFRKLGPLPSAEDRIVYVIDIDKSSHRDKRSIVLQTSTFLYPIGIGHEASDNDSYLFRISSDNVFEVFVADTAGVDDGILIQMFMDGSLAEEICELQECSA